MKKINFKSDFDFIAEVKAIGADNNKVAIDFPQYDWEIILTTDDCCNNSRTYVVSHRKGVATNCYNDNGKIHIICNNHKLPVGQLKMEFRSFLPNSIYPDGSQKEVANYDLDIELTTENTGITSAEVPNEKRIFSEGVWLANKGKESEWKNISQAEADAIKAEQERLAEEQSKTE